MNVVGKRVGTAVIAAMCTLQEGSGLSQRVLQTTRAGTTTPLTADTNLAFIETPQIRSGDAAKRFPRGSRLVQLRIDGAGKPQGAPVSLAQGFFAAADPKVSFDGQKILFAAQKSPTATWQIFEMPSEGGGARQITHCAADCLHPVYLPEQWIAYTSLQGAGADRVSEVEVSRDNGADAHAITFGPGGFEVETVLRSGRLLLSAASPLVPSNGLRQKGSLYLIEPDGSGLRLLRQDVGFDVARGTAEELADGTILFVQQGTVQLGWIRPGALHATTMAKAQSGYTSVHALDDGSVVASRRSVGQQLDLYRITLNSSATPTPIYRGPHSSSIDAVPLAAHPIVQAYRSILHPERASGRIVCLDAYASKDIASGHLSGHVARVRFVTRMQGGEKILGEAPVEKDGSFYATVPADLPIRLMLIGSTGAILKQQRSWMWVRTGEDRGCFGCHESQAQTPENRSPMTLQRMNTPTSLMGDATPATSHRAARP